MKVMLRFDSAPDVCVYAGTEAVRWESCNIDMLDQHIRTLQVARKWLLDEKKRKELK